MGEAKSGKLHKQRKSRSRQMQYEGKEQILTNILLYSITAALSCASFCSIPHLLIYPPPPTVFCCLKLFISLSIPPLTSAFLSPKFLFIIGNLIVLFLVGSFNTVAGDCNHRDPCGHHYRSGTFTDLHNSETEERDVDHSDDDGGERTAEEETVELNKRAADFIARVNYQIRFESAFIK